MGWRCEEGKRRREPSANVVERTGGQKLVRQPWALREPPFKWLILCRPTLYKPVKQATCPLRIALVYWEPKLEENFESFHLTCLRSCYRDSPRCFFNAVSPTLPTVLVMRNVRSFLLLCISSLLFDWKREIVSENRGIILFRCFFFFFFTSKFK